MSALEVSKRCIADRRRMDAACECQQTQAKDAEMRNVMVVIASPSRPFR
jgi:hypothetical protein